jgi:hypothetical protein
MDAVVVGDVVPVVAQGAGVERQQPDDVDAQPGHVVQRLDEPREVAHPVVGRVLEGLDVQLVENGVLYHSVSALNAGLPVSGSRVCLVRALGRNVFAGAGVRGRTGPAVAGAVAGTAPGVGAGEARKIILDSSSCRIGYCRGGIVVGLSECILQAKVVAAV